MLKVFYEALCCLHAEQLLEGPKDSFAKYLVKFQHISSKTQTSYGSYAIQFFMCCKSTLYCIKST